MSREQPIPSSSSAGNEHADFSRSAVHDSIATFDTESIAIEEEQREIDGNHLKNKEGQANDSVWYRRKGFWVVCSVSTLAILAILLLLIFLVIFPAIAQRSLNSSKLTFDEINIRQPITDSGFNLEQKGTVTNAGGFGATVSFPHPITVHYNGTELGSINNMSPITVKGGKANVNSLGQFSITNETAFGLFTADQLINQNVTWVLTSQVDVKAAGITKHGLDFNKIVVLNGSNGFGGGATVSQFNLSRNTPDSLAMKIKTVLFNPSPIGVEIGTLVLNIFYNNRFIAPVQSTNLTIKAGTNEIELSGNVTAKTDPLDSAALSDFFGNFTSGNNITTIAYGVSARPDGFTEVGWLTTGIKALRLDSTFQGIKIDLLKTISLGSLDLEFASQTPYAPELSSDQTAVGYLLPFDMDFTVNQVRQDFHLVYKNAPIAELVTDWSTATNNATTITLDIPKSSLQAQGDEGQFSDFLKDLTLGDSAIVVLQGKAGVRAVTAVGPVELDAIQVNVSTTIKGFSGFGSTNTTSTNTTKISNVLIVGGDADGIKLTLQTLLTNPSDTTIGLGDTSLAIKYQGVQVGTASISNLTLTPGPNTLNVTAKFNPDSTNEGKIVMARFINQTDTDLTLSGFDGCTQVTSLIPALEALNIPTIFPGLGVKLIVGGSLKILNSTTSDSIASTQVTIDNTFATPLLIKSIDAAITVQGNNLGTISVDAGNQPIAIAALKNDTTAPLPVKLNLDPVLVFSLLRSAAIKLGKDVRPLDVLLTVGGINVPGVDTSIKPDPSLFNGFDLKSFVLESLKVIPVDITLHSSVQIGDFITQLDYSQQGVFIETDDSIADLIPFLGQPIVQKLVSGSKLDFSSILLKDLSDEKFNADIVGAIENTGPIPAKISFPIGVKVLSKGQVMGTLSMQDVQSNNGNVALKTTSSFTVENIDALTVFSEQLLGTDSASWDISALGMIVSALGIDFPNISLNQTVTLKGSNGFKGNVKILDFQMPGVAPGGGIALQIKTSLKNEGTVGVDPGSIVFNTIYKGVVVGPVESGDIIQPSSDSILNLKGSITPNHSDKDNKVIEELFNDFIHGAEVVVTTVGVAVIPKSGSCKWLTPAIKLLSIDLELPTPQNLKLIPSVNLASLDLTFTPETAYAPISSSKRVVAGFNNPFGFPLDVQSIDENIIVRTNNADMARLVVPRTPAQTEGKTITTSFTNIPFKVNDGQDGNFDGFVEDLTLGNTKQFELVGVSNAVTKTPSGTFLIQNITFDVQTTLPGLQGLKSAPVISDNVVVKGGTKQFLDISLDVTITNPSTIQVATGDVSLDVTFQGANLGQALLKDLVLKPGVNKLPAQFQYAPKGGDLAGAGATLLGNFLEGKDSKISIQGNEQSTAVASLKPAFAKLKLDSILKGIDAKLIQGANVQFNLTNFNSTTTSFVLFNPLATDFGITKLNSKVFLTGTTQEVGFIDVTPPFPLPIPAKQKVPSPPVPFTFTMDPTKLLPIIIKNHNKLPVDLVVNPTIVIGDFTAIINYEQDNVIAAVTTTSSSSSAVPSDGKTTDTKDLPASKGLPPASKGLPPASKGLPPASKGLPPASKGLPPASKGLPPASKGLPPASKGLPPASKGLPPASKGLPPASKGLPPVSKGLPPANKGLPASKGLPPASKVLTSTGLPN